MACLPSIKFSASSTEPSHASELRPSRSRSAGGNPPSGKTSKPTNPVEQVPEASPPIVKRQFELYVWISKSQRYEPTLHRFRGRVAGVAARKAAGRGARQFALVERHPGDKGMDVSFYVGGALPNEHQIRVGGRIITKHSVPVARRWHHVVLADGKELDSVLARHGRSKSGNEGANVTQPEIPTASREKVRSSTLVKQIQLANSESPKKSNKRTLRASIEPPSKPVTEIRNVSRSKPYQAPQGTRERPMKRRDRQQDPGHCSDRLQELAGSTSRTGISRRPRTRLGLPLPSPEKRSLPLHVPRKSVVTKPAGTSPKHRLSKPSVTSPKLSVIKPTGTKPIGTNGVRPSLRSTAKKSSPPDPDPKQQGASMKGNAGGGEGPPKPGLRARRKTQPVAGRNYRLESKRNSSQFQTSTPKNPKHKQTCPPLQQPPPPVVQQPKRVAPAVKNVSDHPRPPHPPAENPRLRLKPKARSDINPPKTDRARKLNPVVNHPARNAAVRKRRK